MIADSGRPLSPPQSGRRPFVLRILVFLHVVQALIGAVFIALLLLASYAGQAEFVGQQAQTAEVKLLLIVNIAVSLLHLLFALGLWRLQRWAWVLTMLFLAVSMTRDIFAFFDDRPVYISMFVNVIMVFYLNQQEVQELFAVHPPEHTP